jgi:hypothetical protein
MTLALVERSAVGLSRPLSRLAAAAVAVGTTALLLGFLMGEARAALAALDASFLFFAGLSTGSVALAAAVRIANGRWARPILPIADAGVGFFGPALVLLVVLVVGARLFIPWTADAGAPGMARVAVRLLVPTVVLFGLGRRFVSASSGRRAGRHGVGASAAAYCIIFAIALSCWAYDLVLNLSDAPPATVVPAYYFIGAFLSGFAAVALVAAIRDVSGPDLRHDIGKLLFGLIIVWTYLLWSLFLATWYANVPEESAPLLLRWQGAYRHVAEVVLVAVFFWPSWLLFSERLKRRRGTLAFGAATVLAGLWAERFLLVLPPLHLGGTPTALLVGAGVAAGVAGLFLLSVGPRLGAAGRARPLLSRGPQDG